MLSKALFTLYLYLPIAEIENPSPTAIAQSNTSRVSTEYEQVYACPFCQEQRNKWALKSSAFKDGDVRMPLTTAHQ